MFIAVLFAAALFASVLLTRGGTPAVMDEYCRMECKERKIRDYSICC